MGQGYTRNDTGNNIAAGKTASAADIDGEFDALVDAFASGTGHTHDGTTAEGGPIEVTGPAQEYESTATAFQPKTDGTYDLGSATNEWQNLYVDGTAFLDAVDIDSGNIDGTDIGATSPAAGTFTALTANTSLTASSSVNFSGATVSDLGTVTTADIDGGTIDDVTLTTQDSKFILQDEGDNTKQLQFQISGFTTATTRTFTWPDATTTVVGTDTTQTLTNKTVNSANNTLTLNLSEGTLTGTLAEFNTALSDDNFVSLTGTETLTNKTLTSPDVNSPDIDGGTIDNTTIGGTTAAAGTFTNLTASGTVNLSGATVSDLGTVTTADIDGGTIDDVTFTTQDNLFTLQDNVDNTKQAQFQLSGITTATTRTYTVPNADTTLVGTDVTQTLTNKTLSSPQINSGDINTPDIDGGTIDNTVIGGTTPAAGTFSEITANSSITTTGTVNFTSATVSNLGTVTTADINGGTIDGTTIGGTSAAAGTFTSLDATGTSTLTTVDINGGAIDGTTVGATSASSGAFTTITASGDVNFDSGGFFFDQSTGRVGIGDATPAVSLDINSTDAIQLPVGTTAQRPTPSAGMIRRNSTTGLFEGYDGTSWGSLGGAGLFKGENGTSGDTVTGAGDIFRINEQTLNTSTTIDADENASCTGPLTVASGVTLTVTSGGTLAII